MTFYFDLVPPFNFLKWNCFFSTFIPAHSKSFYYFKYYYCGKCVLIYKLKNFRKWNFDTQFECTGVLLSKVTILKSAHLISIYSFWNCLSRKLLLISANNHNLVLIIVEKFKKNSQHSLTLFFNITPRYQQIKILHWYHYDTRKVHCRH